MSYDYTENILVQESAGHLLHDVLGWDVQTGYNLEVLGENGTFGRLTYKEILLKRYVREALIKFNDWITSDQVDEAIKILESHVASAGLMQINQEKYALIRDGIPVTVRKSDGTTDTKRAVIIDFEHPLKNYFLAIKELKIHGDLYRRRTDIVGFVNGIPLLFVELKAMHVDVRNAYEDNYKDYQQTIPQLFYYNAMIMFSNGAEAKVGTLGSKYQFFHEWKRLDESEQGNVFLETMLRGICKKENFLDLVENFILYDRSNGKVVKILARNHQYLGVNAAVNAYYSRKLRDGKLGVFWHTQGSGKSYSMVFMANKILRTASGSPTIMVLTDRDELNRQISGTFESCGLLPNKISQYIAKSGDDLIIKLKQNNKFIFSLIQKFNKPDAVPIYPDHDILIMSDEAHRSQYGIFANNLNHLLPDSGKVSIIGFTGTPLLKFDELTKRTFGGYISVYDFKRAVDDHATVPLYYENGADKIKNLDNPIITKEILQAIEDADLDPAQEAKLEANFAKEIHIHLALPRLEDIAKKFVEHYSELWETGKAMFVCINRAECGIMYNFVRKYWDAKIAELTNQAKLATQQEVMELDRKIHWMMETEMAIVVSQEQNELDYFKKWGIDFRPHREKMEKRDLEKEFKDDENPFRIVFVCAMWLTGFDVPCLANLYLDKPMKAHSLMQAIARANRVCEGKANGLIVDYVGIVQALEKALADYTTERGTGDGQSPTIDKKVLIERINAMVDQAEQFLKSNGQDLDGVVSSYDFVKMRHLLDAVNAMSRTSVIRKNYIRLVAECERLMKHTNKGDVALEVLKKFNALQEIKKQLNVRSRQADTTDLMVKINGIISRYVEIESRVGEAGQNKRFDISRINFDLLRTEFANVKRQFIVIRELMLETEETLQRMMALNPERIDYYERYQKIIEEYNAQQDKATIAKVFDELMKLVNELEQEQVRYVKEGFKNDEELAIFDVIVKGQDGLTKEDIKRVKGIAVEVLEKIKTYIANTSNWRDKEPTQAEVHNIIEDDFYANLPEAYNESWKNCSDNVYEFIYQHYQGVA